MSNSFRAPELDLRDAIRGLRDQLGLSAAQFGKLFDQPSKRVHQWEDFSWPELAYMCQMVRMSREAGRKDLEAAFLRAIAFELKVKAVQLEF